MAFKTWLRRWYWDHMDEWYLSTPARVLKGFYLLVLWLAAAFIIFLFVYHCVLPRFVDKASLKKEPFTLLIPLVTALLGFAVQQWKSLEEEARRRREEEENALREVEELASLLKRDPSEGARRYLELKERPGRIWQSPRMRDALEKIWTENAPLQLQMIVKLLQAKEEQSRFEVNEQVKGALEWAYEHLDRDWQKQIGELLIKKGQGLDFVKQHWQALLAEWPEISLGWSIPAYLDADLIKGLKYLGLKRTPFGHEKAEHTPYLVENHIYPTWWALVSDDDWGIYVTFPKGGRTATALLLAYDALREQRAFPVYWRIDRMDFGPEEIARVVCKTIARYIAVRPMAFTALTAPRKRTVANLLNYYLNHDPVAYLHQIGLPTAGEGEKIVEEITALTRDAPRTMLSCRELLALLSDASPYDFPRLLILADVQGTVGEETALNLYRLGEWLNMAGIILKAFTATDTPKSLEVYGKCIFWEEGDLRELLRTRLLHGKEGEETLEAWCDLRKWKGPPAEERLIRAAQGRPGELIRLGNELLRRIGRNQRLLTPKDFNAVLRTV